MDDGVTTLPDGSRVSKKDFTDLWNKLDTEVLCHKLRPIHFTCKEMDRQNVKIAAQTLSHSVAVLFKKLFPTQTTKISLSEFIDTTYSAFNILNSTCDEHANFTKSAFGGQNLENQLEILNKFRDLISNTKFSGKPRFNNGLIICVKATILLQKQLSEKFNISKLKTRYITQETYYFLSLQI